MCVCVLGATLTKDVFLLTFVFLNPPAKWLFFRKMAFYGTATVTTDGSPWLKVMNFFFLCFCDERWVTLAQGEFFFASL
jgi:hypothetical protein